jgi:hypothetical protein
MVTQNFILLPYMEMFIFTNIKDHKMDHYELLVQF